MDASNGFWQIPVDEESSRLLTFNTPFGRYRFTRLPFGIHSASEVFQFEVAHIIEGIPGAANVQDDILIWSSTKEEHYKRLKLVFDCLKRAGLKLNRSKCVFVATELLYLGHILTSDGIKPDPSKVSAAVNMPVPQCKEDLQRFLGMTNYLCKLLPQYSEVTAPLRKLLKKEAHWHFEKSQLEAINKLKEMTTNSPVL